MREERIQELREFVKRDPNDSFARYALALEYAASGEVELAVAMLLDLLTRDPSYVPAYQQLGYNYQKLDKSAEAIEMFQKGIACAKSQNDNHAASEMQDALDQMSAR